MSHVNGNSCRDGREICAVHAADDSDVDKAVQAARMAFKSWKRVAAADRARFLWKLADLVEQHAEQLATIDAWDNGLHLPV